MNGNENGVSFRQVSFLLYRAGWVSGKDIGKKRQAAGV